MPIKIAQQGQIQIHLKGEWCCAQIAWFSGLIFSLSLSLVEKRSRNVQTNENQTLGDENHK